MVVSEEWRARLGLCGQGFTSYSNREPVRVAETGVRESERNSGRSPGCSVERLRQHPGGQCVTQTWPGSGSKGGRRGPREQDLEMTNQGFGKRMSPG